MNLPNALVFVVHDNLDTLSMEVAQRIAQISAQAIDERGIFRIALAGGETPCRCYERLRDLPVGWKDVHIYFGDERCLPHGDAGRNDRMANEVLLRHIAIPHDNVHAMPAERGARICAMEYAERLKHALPFDLVLLGMGEDGHTASLFPGNPATEQNEIVVPVFNAPRPPADRVSLGMVTLNAARRKIFLVAGANKRNALGQIARGIALPAARVAGAEWHVDRAALPDEMISTNC
jgi:6-phosphogluconolactonase